MASTILALSVLAITHAVTAGQEQTHYAMHEMRAMSLAEALMEEIQDLPYSDPGGASVAGPEAGETSRSLFDNCDDFHDFAETAGHVKDLGGSSYPSQFSKFTRSVTASYTTLSLPTLGSVEGLSVTITIGDGTGKTWTLQRFIPEPTE